MLLFFVLIFENGHAPKTPVRRSPNPYLVVRWAAVSLDPC